MENRMKALKGKIIAVLAVLLIAGAAYVLGTGATFVSSGASAAPILYSQDSVMSIYDSASPAVVEIQVTQQATGFWGRSIQEGQGSGFLIDDQGHILTNNHVVEGASTVQVVLDDGSTIDAEVIGTDPTDDLALISVDAAAVSGITPLQLGDSSAVKPGQMAIALGSPYGLNDSITVGIISGLNRSIGGSLTGMLQTDAAINPGNSGGPLLNSEGQVIGINTAIEADSDARGVGFAVPSDVAKRVLPDLLAGKEVSRPWLGISGTALTQSRAESLGLSVDEGVYVATVVSDSPADEAGLETGDVITAVDGKSVTSVEELSAYLNTKQVGGTVSLSVLRDGESLDVQATLAAWPEDTSSDTTPQPSVPWPWGGRFRE